MYSVPWTGVQFFYFFFKGEDSNLFVPGMIHCGVKSPFRGSVKLAMMPPVTFWVGPKADAKPIMKTN